MTPDPNNIDAVLAGPLNFDRQIEAMRERREQPETDRWERECERADIEEDERDAR